MNTNGGEGETGFENNVKEKRWSWIQNLDINLGLEIRSLRFKIKNLKASTGNLLESIRRDSISWIVFHAVVGNQLNGWIKFPIKSDVYDWKYM